MSPVLVHIGYHKTATTWLKRRWWRHEETGYRWVGDRPANALVLARPFEFDAHALRAEFDEHLARAEAEGLQPVVSLERLSGHPFSGGYDSRELADRVHAVFPEARVLAVVREQRAMIVSTYKQYVRAGGPLPVERFLAPPAKKSARVPWFDFRHFEYDLLIRYYHSLFGAQNVLVLPYEAFARDGRAFVARIADFAGMPLAADVLDGLSYRARPNTSSSALTIEAMRRLNRLAPPTEVNPAPLVRLPPARGLAKWLDRSDALRGAAADRAEASLRRAVVAAVGDRYVASNRRTAALIGADLGEYGWTV